jgi:hypothetical protein
MAVDEVLIPITMFGMIAIVAVGMPLARAYAKRMESGATSRTIPPDLAARLERMEQAIDSIAVEVERISEGQRFTTKLLTERVPVPAPPSAPIGPGVTTAREG